MALVVAARLQGLMDRTSRIIQYAAASDYITKHNIILCWGGGRGMMDWLLERSLDGVARRARPSGIAIKFDLLCDACSYA